MEAHLEGADVRAADFSSAGVTGITFDNKMTCMGARVSTCYGSIRFRRTVEELGFIEEVKLWSRGAPKPTRELFKKKPFSALWTALAYPFRRSAARALWLVDYGRSIWVLGCWFFFLALIAARG